MASELSGAIDQFVEWQLVLAGQASGVLSRLLAALGCSGFVRYRYLIAATSPKAASAANGWCQDSWAHASVILEPAVNICGSGGANSCGTCHGCSCVAEPLRVFSSCWQHRDCSIWWVCTLPEGCAVWRASASLACADGMCRVAGCQCARTERLIASAGWGIMCSYVLVPTLAERRCCLGARSVSSCKNPTHS